MDPQTGIFRTAAVGCHYSHLVRVRKQMYRCLPVKQASAFITCTPIRSFTHPSIHPSSIHSPNHPPICSSIHPSNYPPIQTSIRPSFYMSNHNPSIHLFIYSPFIHYLSHSRSASSILPLVHITIHLFIHPPIYPPIHPSTYLTIYPPTYLPIIHLSINPFTHLSTHPFIYLIHLFISLSIYHLSIISSLPISPIYLFFYLSVCPLIHPFSHPSVHPSIQTDRQTDM